jgi:hypothetical protein
MKDYNIGILQPGQTEEVNVFGNYIRNIGAGSIKVVARNTQKTAKAFSTILGAGGWRSPESEYNHWTVTNNSSFSLPVSVLIGKGEAGESSVQINADVNTTVSNKSINGDQFIAEFSYIPLVYGELQLWNPVNSGKNFLVSKAGTSATNIGVPVFLCHKTTMLDTLSVKDGIIQYSSPINNRDLSANKGSGEARTDSTSVTSASDILMVKNTTDAVNGAFLSGMTGSTYRWQAVWDFGRDGALVIKEGSGLSIQNRAASAAMTVSFEYEEIPV